MDPNAKLRFLCSAHGHIHPRPNSTALTYSGGDTKLLSIAASTLSLSSLTQHFSRIFGIHHQFLVKYQLPGEDLDSLISVASDEDVANMVEEYRAFPAVKRIRIFLFPSKSESLREMKTESWFSDALKGANMIRRGVSADSGLLVGEVAGGKSGLVGAESVVLETSSSFGSTGSTVSMTLPSIGVGEENGGVERRMTKLPSSASLESDTATPTATPHQHTPMYQDSSVHVTSSEATAQPTVTESPNHFQNPTSNFQIPITSQAGPHPVPNQVQHQQEFQYIQPGTHYIPQYPATPGYYPMYYPPLNQHTLNPYHQNHPYPVYYVPVRPTQPLNTPMQYNLVDTPSASIVSASTTPLIDVDVDQNQQQLVDLSEMDSKTQSGDNAEFNDDFAYTQIYKTQPSAPALILQYQTMMTSADNIKS